MPLLFVLLVLTALPIGAVGFFFKSWELLVTDSLVLLLGSAAISAYDKWVGTWPTSTATMDSVSQEILDVRHHAIDDWEYSTQEHFYVIFYSYTVNGLTYREKTRVTKSDKPTMLSGDTFQVAYLPIHPAFHERLLPVLEKNGADFFAFWGVLSLVSTGVLYLGTSVAQMVVAIVIYIFGFFGGLFLFTERNQKVKSVP